MVGLAEFTAEVAPRNHNNPPSDLQYLEDNLTLRHVALIRQAEDHIKFVANIPAEFSEQNEADFTSDFIKKVQQCQKELERNRKEEKEPFLRQGQFVDTFFMDIGKKLGAVIERANTPLKTFLMKRAQAEQARRDAEVLAMRKEQEEAMRAAAQVNRAAVPVQEVTAIIDHAITMTQVAKTAEAVAAAPIQSMAKSAGKVGATMLKPEWVGTIKDVEALDLHKLRPYIPAGELQKALDRFVKQGGRACEGAEIKEVMGVKTR
jgi:hypothetical protein